MLSRVLILAAAVALVIGVVAMVRTPSTNPPAARSNTSSTSASSQDLGLAPDFTLAPLEGGTFHLAAQLGHPVVLYFMATTCATCVQGSQQLAQTMQTAQVAGARALVIDVNAGDHAADLEAFAQVVGQPAATVLQWGIDSNHRIATAYGVQTLESMVVINAQGKMIANSGSSIAPAQLVTLLQSAG